MSAMKDDEDQIWLDTLAGRVPADPNTPAAREARNLHEAIAREQKMQAPDVPSRDPHREAELLARAEREGLLDLSKLRKKSRWQDMTRPAGLLAAAAAVACVAIAINVLVRPSAPVETVRGVQDGIVTLQAKDPAALKRQLLAELRQAGVSATGYERLGRQGVDADLPQPVPEPVREVLNKHHLPVPADGTLKIEIVTADSP
jgi:hypothetical protein